MSRERARAALALLEGADRALEEIRCEASTECCRFRVTGREPWLTLAEWELVQAELAAQGRRLPRNPDEADGRCPFLSEAGRCVVYRARPLGCRTHFCERATPRAPHPSEFRAAARALAELSSAAGGRPDEQGPRPITSWLSLALRGASGRRR